jgi:hypothetical protein
VRAGACRLEQDLQVRFAAGIGRNEIGLPTCGLNGFEALVRLRLITANKDDFRTR